MISNKLISIIIATYNAEKTLERCLSSISKQKTKDIELLIIDGSSTDDTINIIHSYKSIIDFYLSEPDKGIYDAWNKGIKKATGEWIMFIGADDMLLPDALYTYIKFLKENNVQFIDYISAQNEYINSKEKYLGTIGEAFDWNIFRKHMNVVHVASLHHNILFKSVGEFNLNYKICADYELLMRKKNNLKALFCQHKIARIYSGGMSISFKAIYETFLIKKRYNSINIISNLYIFLLGIAIICWKKYLTQDWQ